MNFEWDHEKAESNLRKHRVSFEEAATVFSDPHSLTITDTDHSIGEERLIDLGCSDRGRLLPVVYTERGHTIRMITSRRATRKERRYYEEEG